MSEKVPEKKGIRTGTRVRALSPEAREFLEGACESRFLDGECYAFAIALHRGTGWPIIGLMNGEEIRHAAVQRPDGLFHDARGAVSEAEFVEPFGGIPPLTLRSLTEKDFEGIHYPHSIHMARRLAEALWPELPWRDAKAEKVTKFADALATLSRKHGVWIRSNVPGSPPMLAEGSGDEGGYVLTPTEDGLAFSIDRYFKNETET